MNENTNEWSVTAVLEIRMISEKKLKLLIVFFLMKKYIERSGGTQQAHVVTF